MPPSPPETTQDHDSPWKEALDLRFPEFLNLLFPQVAELIDWKNPSRLQPGCFINSRDDRAGYWFPSAFFEGAL